MAASNSATASSDQRSSSFRSLCSGAHLLPRPRTSPRAHIPSFLTGYSAPEEDLVLVPPTASCPPSSCCRSATLADEVFLDAAPCPSDAKDDALSFVTARISGTSVGACSAVSDVDERSPASSGDEDADDECSSCRSSSCGGAGGGRANKPHQANDARWDAIRAVRARDGHLGLSQFRLLDRVGSGDIGCVYLAELSGTGSLFAVKLVDKAAVVSRRRLSRAHTERGILQCLDHPFLPTLYAHFETDSFSCLVMEFCPGGDLRSLQQRQPEKCFSEKAARFYAAEVLLALEYLHMLGIIYRDLKPENILVREDGHIMLSDFDLSLRCNVFPTLVKSSANCEPTCMKNSCLQPTCFSPSFRVRRSKTRKTSRSEVGDSTGATLPELVAEPSNARSKSFVGTHEYLAPEIIKGEGHGSAVDWWSFGILLYELLFGKTPFEGSGKRATLFNVVGEPLKFPELPMVSFAARDLIRGLLVKEPQDRLAYRRGAAEIKQHAFFQSVNWALIRCASPPEIPGKVENGGRTGCEFPVTLCETKLEVNLKRSESGQYLDMEFF